MVSNEELFDKIKDLYCDGFQEVILDVDSRLEQRIKPLEEYLKVIVELMERMI
ncbi:hypothetical protein EDC18_102406 [Natranaerovirga pectinivora]|uniref:Uncharacterized protein n=1 Tax=Natranaerovirga pectinivora TaxID=682400 RepID=A0A4V2V0J3_9FIRM|nr:hypothetical protein [Natranaerovirga pectinivora]TCT16387.1 hypothetical protein EDC18_102406 [Natranaerovirga pectinivora]